MFRGFFFFFFFSAEFPPNATQGIIIHFVKLQVIDNSSLIGFLFLVVFMFVFFFPPRVLLLMRKIAGNGSSFCIF